MTYGSSDIKVRRSYIRWSPEEDQVLLSTWKEWQSPAGRARDGFQAHLFALFSHRTKASIRNRMTFLVYARKAPNYRERIQHAPLILSVAEAGWLAGIIDGEGSIGDPFGRDGKFKDHACRVILGANTDHGILNRIRELVPGACQYVNRPTETSLGNKCCYAIYVNGHAKVLDVLNVVIPYLAHTNKRRRALKLQEWLRARLGRL